MSLLAAVRLGQPNRACRVRLAVCPCVLRTRLETDAGQLDTARLTTLTGAVSSVGWADDAELSPSSVSRRLPTRSSAPACLTGGDRRGVRSARPSSVGTGSGPAVSTLRSASARYRSSPPASSPERRSGSPRPCSAASRSRGSRTVPARSCCRRDSPARDDVERERLGRSAALAGPLAVTPSVYPVTVLALTIVGLGPVLTALYRG